MNIIRVDITKWVFIVGYVMYVICFVKELKKTNNENPQERMNIRLLWIQFTLITVIALLLLQKTYLFLHLYLV